MADSPPRIRVRWHTDGRVAVCTELTDGPYQWFVWPPHGRLTDEHVSGDGWSELFVTELPEPTCPVGQPSWEISDGKLVTASPDGVDVDGTLIYNQIDEIKSDSLKMFAAARACEQYLGENDQ